jgi:hypothetical protein
MTDNPSVSTAPRRNVQGSVLSVAHAGIAGFVWLARQVIYGMAAASLVFGFLFVLFCFGSALPMFSRNVIFHPGMVMWLKAGFVLIVAIYLLWALISVMFLFMERMAEHYPILGKIGVGLMFLLVAGVVTGMVYSGWKAKPVKVLLPPLPPSILPMPADRVLLHMHIATPHMKKLPARTSAAIPPPWALWTTTNIVGTATVKSLGQGRYEIQMIQPPRVSRHQG